MFFPSEEFTKPPLSYLLARRYAKERRVDEAVREYEKILFYYPDERTAYLELLELARHTGAEKLHQEYSASFRKRFHEDSPQFGE